MRSDSVDIVPERTHGEETCQDSAIDEGGGDGGGGGGYYLCVFLPPGAQDGEMPGARLSGSSV